MWSGGTAIPGTSETRQYVRLGYLVPLLGAYPVITAVSFVLRRRRRRKRGLCVRRGYNLTGLTEPRCPEYGELVA
jgi:hypothetical protein